MVEDIDSALAWHRDLCRHLELNGRVRVSPKGVNVVLSGLAKNMQVYMDAVAADGRWGADIEIKLSGLNVNRPPEEHVFTTLIVKASSEVVSIGLSPTVATHETTIDSARVAQLTAVYPSRPRGEVTEYLGCELVQDRKNRTGHLVQAGYAERVL